jgi:hypothetical protein
LGKWVSNFLSSESFLLSVSESGIEAFIVALEACYAWHEDALKGIQDKDGNMEKGLRAASRGIQDGGGN